jgi:integrase
MRPTGHIRKRGANYEIRYSLGTDASGKRRVATVTFKGEEKDAKKELRRLLRTVDTGEHVDPSRLTVREWLTTWLGAVNAEVSPKTAERYGELVHGFLVPELGKVLLTKLAPANIQVAYAKWSSQGRKDGKAGGLSPRTRRQIHCVLSSALARAVEQQSIARNPADAFKKRLPKVERKEMKTLTPEQATALLSGIAHTRAYWPVLIALATGMRRGEILALKWKNVDLDRGAVRVVESLEETKAQGLRAKAPETEKARAVTLPRFVVDELRRLKVKQAEDLLKLGVRQSGETLVCARADGDPLRPRSLTHEFTRLVRRVKDVPAIRFHDLRHSHATALLLAGVHPKVAQERLGHSTITTTLDIYAHVTETMQQDAAQKLDEAFRPVVNRPASG